MSLVLPARPFVGLRPFNTQDNLLFFGRDEQSIALLQRLHRSHFLAVVGTSGSGKSSLVRAGLIPKLEAGFLVEDRDRWTIAKMKPGTAPRLHLAEAIAGIGDGEATPEDVDRLVTGIRQRGVRAILDHLEQCDRDNDANTLLLVDQFEEVFRFGEGLELARPSAEASDLVSLILELARQRDLPVYVALTMRSDFLGNCDAFGGLPEAVNDSQYLVPRLTREQLREAMLGPVRLFGADMTSRLADRLLNDAADVSDGLPVLQHALLRTWSHWTGTGGHGPIDLDSYEAVGTVERALSNHAEEALQDMSALELDRTKRIFQALTDTDTANRVVRRPARLGDLAEISNARHDEVRAILARFQEGDRSFVIVSPGATPAETLVDICHESLIRQWTRLREWVEEEAASAKIYRRLAETAMLHGLGRAASFRGPDLEIALDWEKKQQPQPAWGKRYDEGFDGAMAFLRQSEAADQAARRAEEQRKWTELRRTRRFAGVLATLLVLALAAAGWAFYAQRRAETDRQRAVALQGQAEAALQATVTAQALMAAEQRRRATAQGRAEAALDSVVQNLLAQLGSADLPLVVSAIDQLTRIYQRPLEEVVAWIPDARLGEIDWLASLALELDGVALRDGVGGEWAAKARTLLAARVSTARHIVPPPSPEADARLNRRVPINGGSFLMGSPKGIGEDVERPQHRVTLSSFRMQEHEVTNVEYRRFDPMHARNDPDDYPVVNVSWSDAMAYAAWLGGSLPTEAQWEFAARGEKARTYPWGDEAPTCDRANSSTCGGLKAVAKGRERGRTPEGVYDLAGNVYEWCRDWHTPYREPEQTDPPGRAMGSMRVLRGGSFSFGAVDLRAASRFGAFEGDRHSFLGFRVVFPRSRS